MDAGETPASFARFDSAQRTELKLDKGKHRKTRWMIFDQLNIYDIPDQVTLNKRQSQVIDD